MLQRQEQQQRPCGLQHFILRESSGKRGTCNSIALASRPGCQHLCLGLLKRLNPRHSIVLTLKQPLKQLVQPGPSLLVSGDQMRPVASVVNQQEGRPLCLVGCFKAARLPPSNEWGRDDSRSSCHLDPLWLFFLYDLLHCLPEKCLSAH